MGMKQYIMYQSYEPTALVLKQKKSFGTITKWIFSNLKVTFRPLGGNRTFAASADVTYNPKETTLTAANLIISIVPKESGCYFDLNMNGYAIAQYTWGVTNDPYSKSIDVMNNLKRGSNSFDLLVSGAWWMIFPQEVTVNISLNLEYIGKEPDIIPPEEQWQKYAPYIVIGVGMAIIGGVLYFVKGRKK